MLTRMIQEHNDLNVITLGDDRELKHGYKGWWAKAEVFSPDNEDIRPCIYLDLDTYVFGSLLPLLSLSDLWLIRDFFLPHRSNSGVMVIPKDTTDIWNLFQQDHRFRTDGDLMNSLPHKQLNDVIDIKSYKADKMQDARKDCTVLCFHGRPKPHETQGWAFDTWMQYSS